MINRTVLKIKKKKIRFFFFYDMLDSLLCENGEGSSKFMVQICDLSNSVAIKFLKPEALE